MRRYVHPNPVVGETATLEGHEHHHLAHVARHAIGDLVVLLDGQGSAYKAQILAIQRRKTILNVLSRDEALESGRRVLRIASAVPRHKRMHMLIEKCSELGVHEVAPLTFSRSVAKPSPAERQRWERIAAESAKQCGRGVFMKVRCPRTLADHLAERRESRWSYLVASLSAMARSPAEAAPADAPLEVLVGPEGGLTEAENLAVAEAGYHPLSLGPHALRVETAAIAAAARLLL